MKSEKPKLIQSKNDKKIFIKTPDINNMELKTNETILELVK